MNFIPSIDQILAVMQNKNYWIGARETGIDLNIVGIRSKDARSNKFDDWMAVFYRMHSEWTLNLMACTTDPGIYWREHLFQVEKGKVPFKVAKGSAILKEDQYKDTYKLGKHHGYAALVQQKSVVVYRDKNLDRTLDFNDETLEYIPSSINIHRAGKQNTSINVDKWSAGCQVVADPNQFKMLMDLCRKSLNQNEGGLTYTLLHENDFDAFW